MESSVFSPVDPVRPVAPYVGGKARLAQRLIAMIDARPHRIYVEPFVGMGGVFLRRSQRPRSEVINDLSGDVSTFFRILQRHYVAFLDMLRFQITTRAEFERLKRVDPVTLTDLERAARFLYLQRTTYGGLRDGVFGVRPLHSGRIDVTRLQPMFEELHVRLAGVTIERLPFADVMRRYDRPETLFFIDPPYYGIEGLYGADLFQRSDYDELVALLRSLAGRFILTINDRPEAGDVCRVRRRAGPTPLHCRQGGRARADRDGHTIAAKSVAGSAQPCCRFASGGHIPWSEVRLGISGAFSNLQQPHARTCNSPRISAVF